MTSAVALLVNEQPVLGVAKGSNFPLAGHNILESWKQSAIQLWGAVKHPNVLFPTLFIFLWQATPHSESATFYFVYAHYPLYDCGHYLLLSKEKLHVFHGHFQYVPVYASKV